jgi:hypothetical protein
MDMAMAISGGRMVDQEIAIDYNISRGMEGYERGRRRRRR